MVCQILAGRFEAGSNDLPGAVDSLGLVLEGFKAIRVKTRECIYTFRVNINKRTNTPLIGYDYGIVATCGAVASLSRTNLPLPLI